MINFIETKFVMKEKMQYKYESVSVALDQLKQKGYTIDYNLEEQLIINNSTDFEILIIYRYEGMSDPDDESTVYGIERISTKEKGFFVVGDLSLDPESASKVLLDLEIKRKTQQ